MRGQNHKKRKFECGENEKENRPSKRASRGRMPKRYDPYELTPLQPKSRGHFDLAFLYDREGQVYVEPVDGRDDLNLVDLLVQRFDDVLSPPDVASNLSKGGTPVKVTQTPRKRQFKRLVEVTIQAAGLTSVLAFYQVPNAQALLERRPPVYPSPSRFKPITPPKVNRKVMSGVVRVKDTKKHKKKGRVNPSRFFNGNSANSVSQQAGQEEKKRHAHSHLVPVHQVGELGREDIVTATEGQNITQMAVENAIDCAMQKLMGKVKVLFAYAEATLMRDDAGVLTHVAKSQTLSYLSPGKTTSLETRFDSQNPNRATQSFSSVAKGLAFELFSGRLSGSCSSSSSELSSDAGESSDQSTPAAVERLDFSAL